MMCDVMYREELIERALVPDNRFTALVLVYPLPTHLIELISQLANNQNKHVSVLEYGKH